MPYPSPITYPSPILYPGFFGGADHRQVSIGDIVFGSTTRDADGVWFSMPKFDGWTGSPGSTAALTQRTQGHGATSTDGYFPERVMTIGGFIHGPNAEVLDATFDRLNAAITLDETLMIVSEGSRIRTCMVQRKGEVLTENKTDQLAEYSVLIVAKDPLKYGDIITRSTSLPSSSGGLVRPSTWPRTWTGVSVTGKVQIENPGNEQAPVWLRIDGPIPAGGWTVTHTGKKQALTFATDLALGIGEFVTVDMKRREILAQGQSPRSGYVTSRGWFTLDPGINEIAFSAQNYSPTALLTVATKPAWS